MNTKTILTDEEIIMIYEYQHHARIHHNAIMNIEVKEIEE